MAHVSIGKCEKMLIFPSENVKLVMELLKRKIDSFLKAWKADPERKPLIVKVNTHERSETAGVI